MSLVCLCTIENIVSKSEKDYYLPFLEKIARRYEIGIEFEIGWKEPLASQLPSNIFVINIKDTSVLNVIGLYELYKIGDIIIRDNFYMFETYLIICVIYFILTFTITRILRLIEKRLAKNGGYVNSKGVKKNV